MSASILSRNLRRTLSPISTFFLHNHHYHHHYAIPRPSPILPRLFSSKSSYDDSDLKIIKQLMAEVEEEKDREREARKKAGLDTADIDAEEHEDYMGVGPLIAKLEKQNLKDANSPDLYKFEEPTDTESEDDDQFSLQERERSRNLYEKKFKRHQELLSNFVDADNLDEAHKWMHRINKFEQKHFRVRPEYRVIGDLLDMLKISSGKEKFLLQMKLNRALRLINNKEAFDPNNPANFGVIQQQGGPAAYNRQQTTFQEEKQIEQKGDDDSEDEFNDMQERDDILLEQLSAIDKKLEEKLAELDHTFGRKGKVLEGEIRDLAEERNSLTEKKKIPLYRKGFDVKLINIKRTCKVTKGGRVTKYTALLACGNYEGVIGFAKAKGPAVPIAVQKAHEKCYQNLHYVERHEEHTIAHAVQTSYKKTKLYLWPARTQTGMKAGRIVQTVLNLAGFKNVKSKVIGSRNSHNTLKALFKALNAIETPKDVQEKFGRTVVESYLL